MNKLIVLVAVFATTMAQRPFYAGNRPIGQPDLATRFKETTSTTELSSSPSSSTLANRVGESDTSTTSTTSKIPVDARGDGELVDRLNQWPREHRPFWLINAEHIEAARNKQQNGNSDNRQQTQARGSFGTSKSSRNTFNNNGADVFERQQQDSNYGAYFEGLGRFD